jgi:type I restriction-modification system DNA methylase subunit
MPQVSWNEVRDRAIQFSRRWADARREAADKQTFWNEFFAVFGRDRRTVASFEVAVRNLYGRYNHIDLLWRGVLLVEHKSAGGNLSAAESQAFAYIEDLARENRFDEHPRFVIVSDFARIALFDLEPDERGNLEQQGGVQYAVLNFPLGDLHRYVRQFAFLKGERTVRLDPEDPANEKAYDRMCQLHDELEDGGFRGAELERLLVRVLFCLFAEDTGIFEPNAFQSFIRNHTREDGSDLGARLNELFDVLNTPERRRPALHEDLVAFPYVNGELFAERLGFAPFTRAMRDRLLEATDFHWARISPAVFGSLFQGVMQDRERRQQGAHYTSERDIMKLVRSLFLDDLRADFDRLSADRSSRRRANLQAFQERLRELTFLDPACGCGNFLVLAYRELRLLELDVLRELHAWGQRFLNIRDVVRVDVDQFYGMEQAEWPTRIAEVALWLMDHQMNQRVSEAFGLTFQRLPLTSTPHIVQANALRFDWRALLPPERCRYVLGNPPFVGKQFRTPEQQADMELVWAGTRGAGVLDYVTCWYRRSAEYIEGTTVRVAFVSTNSITQGEQVGVLWGDLFRRWPALNIQFAHRTFTWTSEARGVSHVHVVIIGFGLEVAARKRIYEADQENDVVTFTDVPNISPYLVAGGNVVVQKRTRPLCGQPEIVFGSMPNDGGHLLLTPEQKDQLVAADRRAGRYLRRIVGSVEFINGRERWCLWLPNAAPGDLRDIPEIMERVERVRSHREASDRATTRALAVTPTLFGEIRQPLADYLLIPGASSENRRYIPMGFVPSEVIASNLVFCLEGATVWHFGVLSSAMHMAWVDAVCGRLRSDFRYSNKLVYNNFPWPDDVAPDRRANVEAAARGVLDARAPFLPPQGDNTLADLYDPLTTPAPLARAHGELDRAVDRCYRPEPFRTARERAEHLFTRYERLTAPLIPAARPARRRRA